MIELAKKPSEESYEIELKGSFMPEKFHPLWFAQNDLLGEKEADNIKVIEAKEGERMFFSTELLHFDIRANTFGIRSSQILSFDLVRDMASSVAKLIPDSLKRDLSFDILFHYSFSSKKKMNSILNAMNQNRRWGEILDDPQINVIRINTIDRFMDLEYNQTFTINVCERLDMKNTLHIFINNTFTTSEKNMYGLLDNMSTILDRSIEKTNGITNSFFG